MGPAEQHPGRTFPTSQLVQVSAIGGGPLLACLLALLLTPEPQQRGLSLGIALAGLGILVAVHIVSAELAANRLPGQVAERTSTPSVVLFSYSIVLTLASISIAPKSPLSPALNGISREIAPFLLAILLSSLLLAMRALIRRTNAAGSAWAFARTLGPLYRSHGRRMSRIRAQAVENGLQAERLTYTSSVPTLSRTRLSVHIQSPGRGFVLLRKHNVEKLGKRGAFRDGRLQLEVQSSLGTITNPKSEIGALVPAPNYEPTRSDLRVSRRCFHISKVDFADDMMEAASQLIGMIRIAAKQGDEATAHRIGAALFRLVSEHAIGVSMGDPSLLKEDLVPVSPFYRAVVKSLVTSLAESITPTEASVFIQLLIEAVGVGSSQDAVGIMVVSLLMDEVIGGRWDLKCQDVLRESAYRAISEYDRPCTFVIRDAFDSGSRGDTNLYEWTEAAGSVCLHSVWNNYWLMDEAWSWFWGLTRRRSQESAMNVSLRTGAAGLLSGNVSISVTVAFDISERLKDPQALGTLFNNPRYFAREQALSDLYGRYLGEDAEAALRAYGRFAEAILLNTKLA